MGKKRYIRTIIKPKKKSLRSRLMSRLKLVWRGIKLGFTFRAKTCKVCGRPVRAAEGQHVLYCSHACRKLRYKGVTVQG